MLELLSAPLNFGLIKDTKPRITEYPFKWPPGKDKIQRYFALASNLAIIALGWHYTHDHVVSQVACVRVCVWAAIQQAYIVEFTRIYFS